MFGLRTRVQEKKTGVDFMMITLIIQQHKFVIDTRYPLNLSPQNLLVLGNFVLGKGYQYVTNADSTRIRISTE